MTLLSTDVTTRPSWWWCGRTPDRKYTSYSQACTQYLNIITTLLFILQANLVEVVVTVVALRCLVLPVVLNVPFNSQCTFPVIGLPSAQLGVGAKYQNKRQHSNLE